MYTKKTLKYFNCDVKLLRFNHSNKSPLLLKNPVNMLFVYLKFITVKITIFWDMT
jgi:hypothetical protein